MKKFTSTDLRTSWCLIMFVCSLMLFSVTPVQATALATNPSMALVTATSNAIPTVTSLADLEQAVKRALGDRQTTFAINYKADSTNLSSSLDKILSNILTNDDYLNYSLKKYGWWSGGYINDITINYEIEYWESKEQVAFVDSEVQRILSQIITPDMNVHQKVKAIHDYIVLHVAYDTTLVEHSAYAALRNGKTVCQGYSLLLYKMLKAVGVENRIIEGKATDSSVGHTWNLVNIEGKWYHLDATFDDPVPDQVGKVSYSYYNLTDDEIRKNHSWTHEYPQATTSYLNELSLRSDGSASDANVFKELIRSLGLIYLLPEYTASNSQQLQEKLSAALELKQNVITLRYLPGVSLERDSNDVWNNYLTTKFNFLTKMRWLYQDYIPGGIDGDVLVTYTFTFNVAVAPTIQIQPRDTTVNVGGSAVLSLEATAVPGILSYQWYSSATGSTTQGTPIIGATGNTFTAPTSAAGTTYYYCIITNTNSALATNRTATTTSRAAKVMVNNISTADMRYNVPITKEWRIAFNQPIDSNTLNGNFHIGRTDVIFIQADSFPLDPILDPSDSRVVILKHQYPVQNFIPGATYQLTVNTGLKSASGSALAKSYYISFQTQAE